MTGAAAVAVQIKAHLLQILLYGRKDIKILSLPRKNMTKKSVLHVRRDKFTDIYNINVSMDTHRQQVAI